MKVITCCFWRRPTYTKKVLEALSRCDGILEYRVIVHIDGAGEHKFGPPEVEQACKEASFTDIWVVVKNRHRGCNRNTREALMHGFAHADYVIHIEDDVQVAPDSLRYLEWASQFKSDHNIFTTGLWCHPKGWMPEQNRDKPGGADAMVQSAEGFYVWGWATWRDRWEEMHSNWTPHGDKELSWDTWITTRVRGDRKSMLPHTSRAINIGSEAGTHRGDSLLSYWAGSPGFTRPTQFIRV